MNIQEMLNAKGQFGLADIEKITYTINYLNDSIDEIREEAAEKNEEMQVYSTLYTEFNRAFLGKNMELKRYQAELDEINKKESIVGKITKKDAARKEELIKNISSLKEEITIDKKNRKDAQENFQQMLDATNNLKASKKINEVKTEIDAKKDELLEIYNFCNSKIAEFNNKWQENKTKTKEALLNDDEELYQQCIVEGNFLIEEKNNFYQNYQSVIDMIEKSSLIELPKKEEVIVNKETKIDTSEIHDDKSKEIAAKEVLPIEPEVIEHEPEKIEEIVEEVQNKPVEAEEVIEELNENLNSDEKEEKNTELSTIVKSNKSEEKNYELSTIVKSNKLDDKIENKDEDKRQAGLDELAREKAISEKINKLIDETSTKDRVSDEVRQKAIKEVLNDYSKAMSKDNPAKQNVEELQSEQKDNLEHLEENIINETNRVISDESQNKKESFLYPYVDVKQMTDSAKSFVNSVSNTATNALGKIKNVVKSGNELSAKIKNKMVERKYNITAGYTDLLNEQMQSMSRGR